MAMTDPDDTTFLYAEALTALRVLRACLEKMTYPDIRGGTYTLDHSYGRVLGNIDWDIRRHRGDSYNEIIYGKRQGQ